MKWLDSELDLAWTLTRYQTNGIEVEVMAMRKVLDTI